MESAHEAFMKVALGLAQECMNLGEVPVGAVVVRDGEIVGCSGNIRERASDPTGHAEIVALRDAATHLGRWNLSDCDLYVTLEPCPMCAGAIALARIRKLVYGAADPKAGGCGSALNVLGSTRLNHRPQVIAGIHAAEAAKLLRSFFAAQRGASGEVAELG